MFEGFLVFVGPILTCSLFDKVGQKLDDAIIFVDESAIEVAEFQKELYFLYNLWFGPVFDNVDFIKIYYNLFDKDDEP